MVDVVLFSWSCIFLGFFLWWIILVSMIALCWSLLVLVGRSQLDHLHHCDHFNEFPFSMSSLFYGPTTNVPITQIKSLSSLFVNWEVWGNLEFGNVKTDCQSFRCIEGVGLKLWLRQRKCIFLVCKLFKFYTRNPWNSWQWHIWRDNIWTQSWFTLTSAVWICW